MSNIQFEGEIASLNEAHIEFVSNVLGERGFSDAKVIVEVVGQPGDNYSANVKRFIAEKDGEVLKMIAKIAPTNEAIRMSSNAAMMFNNEHVMYTEVLPKFTELEKAADVPLNDRLRYAACYGSLQDAPNEIILLEDLRETDFAMFDRFESLKDDAVKMVLKNFASLHSLSYALKHREPDTYDILKSKLMNMWVILGHIPELSFYFEQLEEDLLNMVDHRYKKHVKGSLSSIAPMGMKIAKVNSKSKFSVIQQGDAWTNNIMFRVEDDKPVDCRMIDYQMATENSPAADLHYMIFNCTDYQTRSKHYDEWIDYYHTELDRALSNFGLKANFIFSKDNLEAELRRCSKMAISLSYMVATFILRESDDAAKIKEAMEKDYTDKNGLEEAVKAMRITNGNDGLMVKIKARVEGIIDTAVELGYIS